MAITPQTPDENITGLIDLSQIGDPEPQTQSPADLTNQEDLAPDLAQKSFADFGVSLEICEALAQKGITHPFPIQALTLPVALARHDIIGQAKTGTGKTLGFGIPILQSVISPGEKGWDELLDAGHPQALVVAPTRELAKQVAGDLIAASTTRTVRVVEIYGGVGFEQQTSALLSGCEVVVGTPGRLIDLLKRKVLKLNRVRTIVLDEADEMLDLGFLPDVETLLSRLPATRHTMLFSATMPGQIVALARRYMSQPTHIRAQDPTDQGATVKNIKQVVYRCHAMNKIEVMVRILQANGRGLTIVFVRTKRLAARLTEDLSQRGFAVAAIHGDLGQNAREQAMRAFRAGKVDVLVATDVAARGIDIDSVTHVINYQCPEDEKTYLHRIGRTGRAGAQGSAVSFVDWEDVPRWGLISKALGLNKPQPAETYHTSPHLFTDLDIPTDVGAVLPQKNRTRAGLSAEKVEDLGGTRQRHSRGRSARRGHTASGQRPGNSRHHNGDKSSGSKNKSRNGTASDSGEPPIKTSRRPRKRIRRNRSESAE